MKKLGWMWAGILLLGGTVWAQSGPDRVCEINVTTPKPGAAKMFEEGRKKHNEFHRTEKDKNSIQVWSITTGPNTGSYLTAVCGMTWKEMDGHDAFDQKDVADIARTMPDTIGSTQQSYYVFRTDLSSAGAPDGTPSKMMTVTHFFVKPSGMTSFVDSVKRINAAMKQTKYPAKTSRWY